MRTFFVAATAFALSAPGLSQNSDLTIQREAAAALQAVASPPVVRDNEDCQRKLILCGQQFQSSLSTRDCKLDDGGYADFWSFPVARRQVIAAAVSSSAFAPGIVLFDSDNSALDADVVGINEIGTVAYFAAPDLYTVGIASTASAPGKTGDYLMTLLCDLDKCTPDPFTLCLGRGRFRAQVAWENQYNQKVGLGSPHSRKTDAAGFFTFGDPTNVELLVKVLDFGDSVKVFYGQLTDLKFQLTVTDMETNKSETYRNTSGDCGGLDQKAFDSLPTLSSVGSAVAACAPGKERLCLLKKRFIATVKWRNQYNGSSGTAGATAMSDVTGAFYFSDAGNIELMVKMLDFGDRIAVFYGTLSDLEYELTIEDTLTGQKKTYTNPAGKFCGGLDNDTF